MNTEAVDNPLIKKKIIHAGKEYKKISKGTKVTFHFVTRKCDDEHTVIDDSRKMGKPMELIIGKQFKLEVWETIVQAMAIDEVSSFVIDKSLVHPYPLVARTLRDAQHNKPRSRHCCGQMLQSYGLEYEDLQSLLMKPSHLEFIIELLKVENVGEYVQEMWQLNEKQRLDEVPKLKGEGNELYKNGDYTEAVQKYSKAISLLDQLMISEKPGEPEWKILKDQKMTILLNYAQCKLYLEEYYDVIEQCSVVLKDDPECVKALYRRAKAYASTWNVVDAKTDLERLLKQDPTMESYVQQQMMLLKKIEKEKEEALKENIKGKLFK